MSNKKLLIIVVAFLVALLGCAPKETPMPIPATPPASATPSLPTPTKTLANDSWTNVVEGAKTEGKLTIYSFALPGDIGVAVKGAFENSTGIRVEIISGMATTFVERIKTERRSHQQIASVLDGSGAALSQAKIEGLTQPAGALPVLTDEAWERSPLFDKGGHILGMGRPLMTAWVNTKFVKSGEEPRSWRELLEPRWKGKISVISPDVSNSSAYIFYYIIKDESYFRSLGRQATFSPNIQIQAQQLARGEVPVVFANSTNNVGPFVLAGAPVKAIDMEEGVLGLLSSTTALIDGAPQPNAAKVYLNWLLSREGQEVYHKHSGTRSLRKDVPNFEPSASQVSPKKLIWTTSEGDMQVAQLQRNKVLSTLLIGK